MRVCAPAIFFQLTDVCSLHLHRDVMNYAIRELEHYVGFLTNDHHCNSVARTSSLPRVHATRRTPPPSSGLHRTGLLHVSTPLCTTALMTPLPRTASMVLLLVPSGAVVSSHNVGLLLGVTVNGDVNWLMTSFTNRSHVVQCWLATWCDSERRCDLVDDELHKLILCGWAAVVGMPVVPQSSTVE
jgi:hypothetical protein